MNLTPENGHELSFTQEVVLNFEAAATPNGNIIATTQGEVMDSEDVIIYCSKCGPLGSDELVDHGLSEFWELV